MKIKIQKTNAIIGLIGVLVLGIIALGTSATVSHKPSEIVPQGHGSGLDADTLDGLHAADLLADSGTTDERKITLWGTSTCPTGYNTLHTGLLTRFSAYSTFFGAIPPAVNVFVCAAATTGNTTATVAGYNTTINGVASWGVVLADVEANEILSGSTREALSCAICERNTTA